MPMSYIALNRITEEQAAQDRSYRRTLERNGRPLLSHGRIMSDDELTIGLPEIQHQERLLPIEFRKRETFAYAIEAYSRICELAKKPAERRALFAELASHPLPPTDFVETEEYLDILKEAISQRNGWKAILKRCMQQVTCSQRRPRKSKSDCD